jgi:starvation-inducible outer membrane lipoprotein
MQAALHDPENHMIIMGSVATVATFALVLVACSCMPKKTKAKTE